LLTTDVQQVVSSHGRGLLVHGLCECGTCMAPRRLLLRRKLHEQEKALKEAAELKVSFLGQQGGWQSDKRHHSALAKGVTKAFLELWSFTWAPSVGQ
jgi:hypothetical protein